MIFGARLGARSRRSLGSGKAEQQRIAAKSAVSYEVYLRDRTLKLARVVLLHLRDAFVRSQKRVFGHIRGIFRPRRMLAHGFGQRTDVMRPGAAAHAQIADVHRESRFAEFGDLEAVAGERIE